MRDGIRVSLRNGEGLSLKGTEHFLAPEIGELAPEMEIDICRNRDGVHCTNLIQRCVGKLVRLLSGDEGLKK